MGEILATEIVKAAEDMILKNDTSVFNVTVEGDNYKELLGALEQIEEEVKVERVKINIIIPPTYAPTKSPSMSPSISPTSSPTKFPTESPTDAPTKSPTTPSPTSSPTNQTLAPTQTPTLDDDKDRKMLIIGIAMGFTLLVGATLLILSTKHHSDEGHRRPEEEQQLILECDDEHPIIVSSLYVRRPKQH